jgi:hypothetical protein
LQAARAEAIYVIAYFKMLNTADTKRHTESPVPHESVADANKKARLLTPRRKTINA